VQPSDSTVRAIVTDFADSMMAVDVTLPVATNSRSGIAFKPGIGPHSETRTVELVVAKMAEHWPDRYRGAGPVPYPNHPRLICDLGIRPDQLSGWAIEIKMLRLLGDNGKLNDNMLMHVLSPYPHHRSAVTDVGKLRSSGFECRKGILIYGYVAKDWPLEPVIDAFERIVNVGKGLSNREHAGVEPLSHPVHNAVQVFGWELLPNASHSDE
jgi:hypothetical protein